MPDAQLIDTTEAMRILGEHRTAVIRMIQLGVLPYVVKGSRGRGGYQFDRPVVERLAVKRDEARRVLGVKRRPSRERDRVVNAPVPALDWKAGA